ncbi:MAG: 16S rRNA (cytosine(1402)-N(4))-methyltransferase RsmH [Gammaproteobacteria bacterium]|nr:16S rRNA (cytosine(1402)-N(4))-methyltransferase RsmH [Gammaproteobacteria bacterium]
MQPLKSNPVLHQPVMLAEAIAALNLQPDGLYFDGTFGVGGHSRAILNGLSTSGELIATDKDPQAGAFAAQIIDPRFHFYAGSFLQVYQMTDRKFSGILLDLGVSSVQIDRAERGFSFQRQGPLDMRMDTRSGFTLHEWLSLASEDEIGKTIKEFGEERYARNISRALVNAREQGKLPETTLELAALITRCVRTRETGKHPATRTFQAFRIKINHELQEIQQFLMGCLSLLKPQGRLVVISFHSLEDRLVKIFMNKGVSPEPTGPFPWSPNAPKYFSFTKRLKPTLEECQANPRARSAILRYSEALLV